MIISYICFMILIYILAISAALIACYFWVKLVFYLREKVINLINKKRIAENNNPYIVAQKLKMKNDRDYDSYLDWMNKNGDGVPFEKIKTSEDLEAEKKISKHLQ